MSQPNSSYSPLSTQKRPFGHLPMRKRPAIETTIKTPKKQYVKLLELERQRQSQHNLPQYPPASSSHALTNTLPIPFKKQPLKKAYFQQRITSQSTKSIKLPGNPLLWNNGNSDNYGLEMSTEDTINSFKAAWLENNQERSQEESQEEFITIKKPSKRKRSLQQKSTEPKSPKRPNTTKPTHTKYTADGKLYCLCRQPYDIARFMIACDRCDDWFHGECIGIKEIESEFIDLYYCKTCSQATGKSTSWKPKCTNPNCFKAARISQSSGHLSKYCSDSCGLQVARARIELMEIKRRHNSQDQRVSIAQLALEKHRQLRLHSPVDRQHRQRIVEIRKELEDVRRKLVQMNQRLELLASQEGAGCGFNPALIGLEGDVCQRTDCVRHEDWKNTLLLGLRREKQDELDRLDRLEEERRQLHVQIRRRRSDQDIADSHLNITHSF